MDRSWKVWKFGGTSIGDAVRIQRVVDVVAGEADTSPLAVVVSAMVGVTNWLAECCGLGAGDLERLAKSIREHHADVARTLQENEYITNEQLINFIKLVDSDVQSLVVAVVPEMGKSEDAEIIRESICGLGEVWSSTLLDLCLETKLPPSIIKTPLMDSRTIFRVLNERPTVGLYERVTIDKETSSANLSNFLCQHPTATLLVAPGFICRDAQERNRTFMRNGGDYSAALLAELINAVQLTIWTDVEGMYTADPRLIPDAVRLSFVSYAEAIECAYFGAKVLHPFTMEPCVKRRIPIILRSSFEMASPGTLISSCPCCYFRPEPEFVCCNAMCSSLRVNGQVAKAFSLIKNVALLTLNGTSLVGVPGIACQMFAALRDANVSCILITQGSSEHSICVGVSMEHLERAQRAVETAFCVEMSDKEMSTTVTPKCAVVSAVGDNMCGVTGTLARLATALAGADVNVCAICQGASERAINFVILEKHSAAALVALHSSSYPTSGVDLPPPPTTTSEADDDEVDEEGDTTQENDADDDSELMADALMAQYTIVLLANLPIDSALEQKINAANVLTEGLLKRRMRPNNCRVLGVTDGWTWCPMEMLGNIDEERETSNVSDLLKLPEAQSAVLVDVRTQQSVSPIAFLSASSAAKQQKLMRVWRKLDRVVVSADGSTELPCMMRPGFYNVS